MPWHMSVKMINIISSENKSFKFYWLYNFLLWQIIILYFDFVLWIYNYLWNHCLSLLKLWVRIPLMARCTRYNFYVIKFVSDLWHVDDFLRFFAFRNTPVHPRFFSGVRVTRSLVLFVCFVDRCLSFFFWPLCCLSVFDLRILITPLGSSNSSYM
jgi:hypothetical protein